MASDFEALRRVLQQEFDASAREQHQIFLDAGITVEYNLLGHFTDLLHTVQMLTYTIDRVRFDEENQS